MLTYSMRVDAVISPANLWLKITIIMIIKKMVISTDYNHRMPQNMWNEIILKVWAPGVLGSDKSKRKKMRTSSALV